MVVLFALNFELFRHDFFDVEVASRLMSFDKLGATCLPV
jgi:hypothetical protein